MLFFYAHNKNYPEEEFQEGDPRKIAADIYIDDRNIGGLPDWGTIYNMIKTGTNFLQDFDSATVNSPLRGNKNWLIRLGESWERSKNYQF